MKKVAVMLICILFLSVFVSAQSEVYSGSARFIDNVKLFFLTGDAKVQLALDVREKEIDSAINNFKEGDDDSVDKNIENAVKKIQLVQRKMSAEMAQAVIENSNAVQERIVNEGNLSDNFDVYVMEEEKTQLTAELVIEVEGEQGQKLEREVVRDEETGRKTVQVVIETDEGERVVELENEIAQIQNQIAERVVKMDIAQQGEMKNGVVVNEGGEMNKKEVEIKTASDGEEKNEVVGDDEGGYAEGTTAGGDSGDTIEETYDDDTTSGDCGEGVVCGGDDDVVEGGTGDIDGEPCIEGEAGCAD